MNLPNILTVSRFFLSLFFIYYIYQDGLSAKTIALLFFLAASLTDYLDGYFAKKLNLISDFGKIMDPIADKFLMLAAFFIFANMALIDSMVFVLIASREVLITAWRLAMMRRGKVLAAESLGKYKTVSQVVAIIVIMIFVIIQETSMYSGWSASTANVWFLVIYSLMLIVVALTLISGILFFWKNRRAINVG